MSPRLLCGERLLLPRVWLIFVAAAVRPLVAGRTPSEAGLEIDDADAAQEFGESRAHSSIGTPTQGELEACPWLHDDGSSRSCAARATNRPTVLLAVTGLRQRLIVDSAIEQVVGSLSKDGVEVHVYLSLVDKPDDSPWAKIRKMEKEPPWQAHLTHSQLRERVSAMVEKAGGCLMCMLVSTSPEALPSIPNAAILNERMAKYAPAHFQVGANVLRVWKARQGLWTRGTQAERELNIRYNLAMWARDDTHWVGRPLDLRQLLQAPGSPYTVWSKGCGAWDGMNDKVVVTGRHAANTMFAAYDSFFALDGPPLKSDNAEQFLMKLADSADLKRATLSHLELPFGDAMYVGSPTPYCFIKMYWCGEKTVSKYNASFCASPTK